MPGTPSLAPDALRRAAGAVDSAQVAALDQAAARSGQAVSALMEVAGLQVARRAWEIGGGSRPVLVVAGSGNNGGDGLVAARYLAAWDVAVSVILVAESSTLRDLPKAQLESARAAGVGIEERPDGEIEIPHGALVIDALLGSGVHGDPRPPQARAITAMAGHDVLSVDIPSGLDASTGAAGTPCVRARWTVTLAAMKSGLWSDAAREWAGEISVADIGIPASAWRSCGLEPPSEVRGAGFWTVPSLTHDVHA